MIAWVSAGGGCGGGCGTSTAVVLLMLLLPTSYDCTVATTINTATASMVATNGTVLRATASILWLILLPATASILLLLMLLLATTYVFLPW